MLAMMEENDKKVKPGWYIPATVRDLFTDFCNRTGSVIQEDFAGALIAWCHLPAEIRERAKLEAKGFRQPDKQFWSDFDASLRSVHTQQMGNQKDFAARLQCLSDKDYRTIRELFMSPNPADTIQTHQTKEKRPVSRRRIGHMERLG